MRIHEYDTTEATTVFMNFIFCIHVMFDGDYDAYDVGVLLLFYLLNEHNDYVRH